MTTSDFNEDIDGVAQNSTSGTAVSVIPDTPVPAQTMLDGALHLASLGYPVFPCATNKKPLIAGGFKSASSELDLVRRWWTQYPNAMLGLPTGEASGFAVLDLDVTVNADGTVSSSGLLVLQKILHANGWYLPETLTVRTPSGGLHMYFQHEASFTNSAGKIAPGVDTRGQGGYVIAPPSRRADGASYEVISADEVGSAIAPDWLAFAFRYHRLPSKEELAGGLTEPPKLSGSLAKTASLGSTPYGLAALSGECATIAGTAPGGRNEQLNISAFKIGQLVQSGDVDRSEAEAQLLAAALECGLPDYEARPTIQSGIGGGLMNPRPTLPAVMELQARAVAIAAPKIVAMPYSWKPGHETAPRDWLYEPHLIRGYLSVTVAPGGVGKSSLILADALAMASGRKLLRSQPSAALNVWVFNLEDPLDEMERRMAATYQHYGITRETCHGGIYLNSGRDTELVVARQDRDGAKISEPVVEALVAQLIERQIDVLIIDPFVSSHLLNENDNGAIDMVAKMWSRVAHEAGCAIELVHHTRKGNGTDIGVDDARGASALVAAARSVRTLNRVSPEVVAQNGLDATRPHFCVTYGKANLTPSIFNREWYAMKSVDLGNGPKTKVADKEVALKSDSIGVVVAVDPVEAAGSLEPGQIRAIQDAIHGQPLRAASQSPDWFGNEVARVLEIEPNRKDPRLKAVCEMLLKNGHLEQYEAKDKSRKDRPHVRVGKWVGDPPDDKNDLKPAPP